MSRARLGSTISSLADQNLFGRQLYRMGQDKAVVLVTYASGDKQLRADAPALMALKAAYEGKGVEMLAVASRLGERREPVIADAKAMGLDMPIPFDLRAAGRRGAGHHPGRRGDRDRSARLDHRLPRSRGGGEGGCRRPGGRPEGGPDEPRAHRPADRVPGTRARQHLRPDFLRQDHRPDGRGQVYDLPPAGRNRPDGAEHLRADQRLLADDPRGDPHPPHAALRAGRDRGPVEGRRAPLAGADEDPGPLDRRRGAAWERRGPAEEDQLPGAGMAARQTRQDRRDAGREDPGQRGAGLPVSVGSGVHDRRPVAEGDRVPDQRPSGGASHPDRRRGQRQRAGWGGRRIAVHDHAPRLRSGRRLHEGDRRHRRLGAA